VSSLSRHYALDPKSRTATILVNPALDDFELTWTLSDLAIAMLIMTWLAMKTKKRTNSWAFADLNKLYKDLLTQSRNSPSVTPGQ
jgi:hypothetical protein